MSNTNQENVVHFDDVAPTIINPNVIENGDAKETPEKETPEKETPKKALKTPIIIPNEPENSINSWEGTCTIICGLLLSILLLALVASYFTYIILGIKFLVEDYKIAKDCEQSNLWAYVLVSIIITALRANSKKDDKIPIEATLCALICLGMVEVTFASWGGVELWKYACDDLQDTSLWEFALVTFSLQLAFASIFLIIMPICMCGYACFFLRLSCFNKISNFLTVFAFRTI